MKPLSILTGITLTLSLVLTACGSASNNQSGGSEAVRTIKIAHFFAEDHPQNIALKEKFKPFVEEKSGGKLKVQIFANSQLGAEKEFTDGVRNGTIEMGLPGGGLSTDMPKLGVPEWPFLFHDYAHAKKVLTGPIGEEITKGMVEKLGIRPLAITANGMRVISSNKPIQSMEDLEGFRLRMPNIRNYLELGKLWKANVVPLPMSEVFTALEQKVIDGQENPYATLKASGWYEVQSHVLESYHIFSHNIFVINEKFWNSLTPEQQQIIQEASKTAADYGWDLLMQEEEEIKNFLQEKGLKITVPDETLKQQMRQNVEPMYEQFYAEYDWAKDLVERIRAEAN